MEKVLIAAILIGLSGTSLMAAPTAAGSPIDLGALPSDIQAKIKSAESAAGGGANPIQQYFTEQQNTYIKYTQAVDTLLEKNPYLKDNPTVKSFLTVLSSYYTKLTRSLNTIKSGIAEVDPIQADLSSINVLYEGLAQLTFPSACQTYSGQSTTGWVKLISGSKTVYGFFPTDNNEQKYIKFLQQSDGVYDVGKMGTTNEYDVPIANNKQVVAQLGPDGNGNQVVVCIGQTIGSSPTETSPISEPTKK
ncbi:MAG: hypothetical protein JSR85_02635 [Proteobacteria bacterium]|nr:hypothetical protein [Pseudomonadota bacterium]